MRLFPKTEYSIILNIESSEAISRLEKQTKLPEGFIMNYNLQLFLGEIKGNQFEIKLSKFILGEICLLQGELDNKKGHLKIITNKPIKIICSAFLLFILVGIIIALIKKQFDVIPHLILTLALNWLFYLELGFIIMSKIALKKLTEIIEIKEIEK